jgi:hypothetical protein
MAQQDQVVRAGLVVLVLKVQLDHKDLLGQADRVVLKAMQDLKEILV